MRKYASKLGIFSAGLALVALFGATAAALPSTANGHAQAATTTQQTAAKQRLCLNRERVIDQIMTRIDTRANNQYTLFSGIATKVENFYTTKGKTLSNYDALVAAVTAAQTKEQTDFGTLKSTTFTCSASDPRAIVTGFQSYLKLEIADLQSLRTAVKNLIVGVAHANGTTLSGSSTSTGSGE